MKLRLFILVVAVLSLAGIVTGFFATKKQIKKELTVICTEASKKYNRSPREALILQLNDDTLSVKLKSSTIWALGKLKEVKALPDLEWFYKEYADPKNKYHNCCEELEKAIGYIKYDKTDLISFDDFETEYNKTEQPKEKKQTKKE
ncbi:MAG TPA: hypothetical protein PKH79_12730 [Prolixibacteraceae bacterium]|nr:hypothetical protein [Prolixibacteraceae bacterium]HPS13073.1 hypothetical protein [Prolixibacteraceae bacterium]